MAVDIAYEKYSGSVNVVEIGATAAQGGSRRSTVTIGGATSLAFLFKEGTMPHAPAVALEVYDCEPQDWADGLKAAYGDSLKDPLRWAKRCVEEMGAPILCVRLMSAHPDYGARPAGEIASYLKTLAKEVPVPLIVLGCGNEEADNEVLAAACQAMKGERCLFGIAEQNNYKTLTANCLADGHAIIAESPIDVNIAKQVNILIGDMGFDAKRIVMHPTTASLGYGMEYVYSIMERARLAAFAGDAMLSMPFMLFTGQEVWRVKEAKESTPLGVSWEIATAAAMLQAGADLLVMRHPKAAAETMAFIGTLMKHS